MRTVNKKAKPSLRVLSLAVALALAACAPKGDKLYARAAASLTKGDTNAAVIDLKNLLQDEPENAKARALLGTAFVNSGQIALGEMEIQKAKDLGAPKAMLLVPSCRVLIAKAQYEQALTECKPEAGSAEDKLALQLATGSALLGLNRPAEAKAVYEAIVTATPENVEAWIGYANAVKIADGIDAAKATLTKVPATAREQPRYWLAVAGMDASVNAYANAEAAFKTAVEKTEKAPEGFERLMALGGLAEMQMRRGNVAEAETTSARLMKLAPKNPMVMQLRGQIAAAGGDLDEARNLFEQVVSGNPGNYEARLMLGMVNMQQGKLDQAEEHLKAVVANNPQNVRAQQLLAEVRARLGMPAAESLAGVQTALEQSPNDPTMLATAGRLSLQGGDRAQALTYLAEASKAGANADPQAQLNIANGYLMAGEVDRALEILKAMPEGATSDLRDSLILATLLRKGDDAQLMAESKAILARPGLKASNRNMVGSVYAAAGKRDLAREQFNEALKQAPDDVPTLMNLARLDFVESKPAAAEVNLNRILKKDPKNLQATLGLAAAAGMRKDLKAAEKYLKQASTDHPDSIEAQMALAQLYLSQNDPDKARAAADAMVAANPQSAAAANARGVLMVSAKDVPAAIASFEKATALDPKSVEYGTNLARAKVINRDASGALSTLDGVLANNPKSVPVLALASAVSLQSGNNERATGYVERLRQAAPGSAVTAQMEGDLAMAQKRYRDALAFYEKADPKAQNRAIVVARFVAGRSAGVPQPERVVEQWVAANPADAEMIGMLGEDKRTKGDLDGAIRLYEQSLAKAPGSAVLANNLAMVYIEKGDPRALATAERAYKAMPKVPAIQDTYGWALVKAGKADQAVEMLNEAAKGMPGNAEVQFHLAAALAKSGRKAEALPLAQKAVAGNLPPSVRTEATKLLNELK
jgi:putative PEP-CTERM system TPR-repeat lipoprotein